MALPNKFNEKELKEMANKTKEWYVEHNDFEGAFESRYPDAGDYYHY